MSNIGSLVVDLALESANFINGLRTAQAQTQQTSTAIAGAMNIAKGAAAGFLGALSVDMIAGAIGAAFDYGDAIVDLADRTGASTKMLQEFRYAAQMSGSSVESADAAVDKFAKNLGSAMNGNKAMAQTFKDLGVTSSDTDTALRQTMDGIAKLGTVTQRNQQAVELFGKSAADMTVLLSGGSSGFDELAAAAESYGIVLDDHLLRNGGQVNDTLDTMRMILSAQTAGFILQNADALMSLANGFLSAATAASHFFSQMDTTRLMSVANGVNFSSDIPTVIRGRLQGKSNDDVRQDARNQLKTTHAGRQALHDDLTTRYNNNIRAGRNKNDADMQAMVAERHDIAAAEARARRGQRVTRPPNVPTLPTPKASGAKPKPAKAAPKPKAERTPEELAERWNRALLDVTNANLTAQSRLSLDARARAGFERQVETNDLKTRFGDIDMDTGTDQQVKEGKKRYTKAQADQLKLMESENLSLRNDLITREELEQIAKDELAVKSASLSNVNDLLHGEEQLARSASERRAIQLKIIENEFQMERLQLEAITASKESTQAEKDIAQARLNILDKLKGQAVEGAKQSTMGPLATYLDGIPQTLGEVNEALETVQVEGIEGVVSGFKDMLKGTKSFGDAFSGVLDSVLDGILEIILKQALIKPLGSLLGGGDGGGGGLFGSLLKSIVGGVTKVATGGSYAGISGDLPSTFTPDFTGLDLSGARANGGLTQPGVYKVGERGEEYVNIGAPANVTPNAQVNRLAANDNRSGIAVNINGPITSNDPAMVRAMIFEGVAAAMPMITKQSTDATLKKLGRRGM